MSDETFEIKPGSVYIEIFATENDSFGCGVYNTMKVVETNPMLVFLARGVVEILIEEPELVLEAAKAAYDKQAEQLELPLESTATTMLEDMTPKGTA